MYNYPNYNNPNQLYINDLQNMRDRIDNQMRQIQMNNMQPQPTAINQTFQLAPNNNSNEIEGKFVNNIDEVKNTLVKIRNKYCKVSKDIEYADLSSKQKRMYDVLKEWRMNKTEEEGFFSAYMVFTNSELINIICANIVNKEDLLSVKGIGNIKYSKYADN